MLQLKNATQAIFDFCSIGLAIICTIHCLFLPFLLSVLPTLTLTVDKHIIHQVGIGLALISSLIAVSFGYRKHRDRTIVSMAIIGLSTLAFAAWLGHDVFGETGEKTMTIVGACILLATHFRNIYQTKTTKLFTVNLT